MNKNKGFTLIELLAVIVILAIIALIATPLVLGVISKAKEDAFLQTINNAKDAFRLHIVSKEINDFPYKLAAKDLELNKNPFISGWFIMDKDGKISLEEVSDGSWEANGKENDLVIVKPGTDTNPPTNPLLSLSYSGTSIIINMSAESKSGIKEYKLSIDGGSNWIKSTTNKHEFKNLDVNKEYTVLMKAVGKNGLESAEVFEKIKILALVNPKFSASSTNWINTDVKVSIDFGNIVSDFEYSYSVDNGNNFIIVTESVNEVTLKSNGIIIAKVVNKLTNEEVTPTYNVSIIDKEPPACISSGGNTNWTNGNRVLSGQCSDSLSSCVSNVSRTVSVEMDSTTESPGNVRDKAGNITTCPSNQTVKIDKTPPVIVSHKTFQVDAPGGMYSRWDVEIEVRDNVSPQNLIVELYVTGSVMWGTTTEEKFNNQKFEGSKNVSISGNPGLGSFSSMIRGETIPGVQHGNNIYDFKQYRFCVTDQAKNQTCQPSMIIGEFN